MGMTLCIVVRNMLRHKRRTITSAITISVGMAFYIMMDTIMAGLDRGGIDNMIELSSAAVKVHTKRYEENKEALPLDHGIEDIDGLRSLLANDSRVTGVTRRTRFMGQLSNYEEVVPVVGTVIDPTADSTVFALARSIEGTFFSAHSGREIILGKALAQELGLELGGYITLYALTRYDSRNADEFEVVGMLSTTDPDINQSGAYISYAAANEFLDLGGLATEVDIAITRRVNFRDMAADAAAVCGRIAGARGDLATVSFMELAGSFLEIAKSKRGFGIVFLGIVLLIAAVGIFNTVLMSVFERTREIGVLRAHGMSTGEVTRMFMLEGVLTGIFGSLCGMALGLLVNWVLVVYGYPIDKIVGDMSVSGIPYWGTVYGEWNPLTYAWLFVFGVVISTVAGLIPARRAGTLSVTDALRFV